MVAQISLVSSDIRAHIEKIEAFSLLQLDDDGAMAALAATKRDSYVRFLVARPSSIVVEELATIAATAHVPPMPTTMLTVAAADNAIYDNNNATTPTDMATDHPRKSDVGLNVTFVEDTSMPIREYFHLIDEQRNEKVRKIKELFESIGPILIKLESLILGTFTGESAKMKLCYADWEKELFKLLIR